ncbi:hypothetical protein BBD39_07330 [Arsenophonus endosymbiont of Bemisia tabaci Asia II 3]|nr:hypothetical protein BBD39_07330 [Arsenophonus endosymbiont of Bemisia tabaci Asia II 3]
MSEIMRFSLCKSKITKYIFGIVLVSFIIPMSNAQPPQNINNFHTVSWNSNGPRWLVVQTLMNLRVDILAIQEAGDLNAINNELTSLRNPIPICYDDFEFSQSGAADLGFNEYEWTTRGQSFYIYYYNTPVTGTAGGVTKQNIAIVSRQRADEIMILPNQTINTPQTAGEASQNPRTFINRPVLGIRIANSVFFNIHPEPNRARNEAPILLNMIQNYMDSYYPNQTWMAMGDFNRTPTELRPDLPAAGNGRFINILNTGVNTRVSGELDYAVVGGPIANQATINAIVAAMLAMPVPNPSDHLPVKFN